MPSSDEGLGSSFELEDVLLPSNYIESMTTHAIFEAMKREYEKKHGKLLDFPETYFTESEISDEIFHLASTALEHIRQREGEDQNVWAKTLADYLIRAGD